MITLTELRSESNIHMIPKSIGVNKGVVLDSRLYNNLMGDGRKKYDFDVYLPKYGINLQRPYVWNGSQCNEFIKSLVLEKPIDSVVVVVNYLENASDEVIEVIDGKQRLMTIKRFMNNEFPITVHGQSIYFKDFDKDCKIQFKSRVNAMTATMYFSDDYEGGRSITDDMKIILFNYYNFAGTPQDEEHKVKLQNLIKCWD